MRTKVTYLDIRGKYYTPNGSTFINPTTGICLVISTRKRPTKHKPPQYILSKTPQGAFDYVSSLYPMEGYTETYTADYGGQLYVVTLTGGQMEIQKLTE